jgi:xylulokinase
LDGERTPNLPAAAGTIAGLRHATTPGQILRAAYEGVIATLLLALDALEGHLAQRSEAAPIVLIGGGARGSAWREVLARLSGRAIEVPAVQELVAYGAAAQAAAVLGGEHPEEVAARWRGRGTVLQPPQRDERALQRFRHALAATAKLNEGG